MASKGRGSSYRLFIESRFLVVWSCLFAAVVCCVLVLYSRPASSERIPVWATFTQENSDLPSSSVLALAGGADGALWVGTVGGGLGKFIRPLGRMIRIVEVIGGKADELNKVIQPEQTIAVTAFDNSYLTQPGMFHYIWRLSEVGLLSTTPGQRSRQNHLFIRRFFHIMACTSFASLQLIVMATGATPKISILKWPCLSRPPFGTPSSRLGRS